MIANPEKSFRSKKLAIKGSHQFINTWARDGGREYVSDFSFNSSHFKNRTLAGKMALVLTGLAAKDPIPGTYVEGRETYNFSYNSTNRVHNASQVLYIILTILIYH